MTRAVTLSVILATASMANADDNDGVSEDFRAQPRAYVASGATKGRDQYDFVGFVLEGGMQIRGSAVMAHALAHTGTTQLVGAPGAGRGSFVEARAGVEGRRCTASGMLCGSLGVDVGAHRGRFTPRVDYVRPDGTAAKRAESASDNEFDSLVVAPRLTVDGGGRIRARAVIEVPQHLRAGESVSGVAVSLALGVAF